MKKIDVSIIVVHYMVKKEIFECLESIYRLERNLSFEIIVVDNDETRSVENELRKRFSKVIYIKSQKNLGYGGGNNLGSIHAKGDYLFFLNPDTKLINNSINKLFTFIKKNSRVGIASPLLVGENMKPFGSQSYKDISFKNAIYSFSFLRFFFPNKNIYKDLSLSNWNKKSTLQVDVAPGAALMISNNLFKRIGGFDETFFLYFEEYDISRKVKNLGFKLFIDPKAIIMHKVGQSTKHLKKRRQVFNKSRLLYFIKYFGVTKTLLLELFLRINVNSLMTLLILFLAFFLRVNDLSQGMVFIGDQGWFYLSARDLLTEGNIPLVGITSSHTWLHQGPLWTYMLSIPLVFFNFNPVSGGYFTAILGVITVYVVYKIGSELFSLRTGAIASLLYAVSPLIISFDRMPYHTSPIALFTALYFYALFKWTSGKSNYFPITIFLIAILYNLELATFILFFPFAIILIYGLFRRESWVKKILNKKTIIYALILFILPMLPILIYDFSNGFKQTFVFLGWTLYKPFSLFLNGSLKSFASNVNLLLDFIFTNIQKLIFSYNLLVSVFIFLLSVTLLIYREFSSLKLKISSPTFLLIFLLTFSLAGIFISQTPSDAYLPILFPFIIFAEAIFFDSLTSKGKLRLASGLFLFLVIFVNVYSSYLNSMGQELKLREQTADNIISLSNGKKYNLIGNGIGSQFESFTMNYEYLLWWKKHPPSTKSESLKIIISEDKLGIHLRTR